MSPTIRLATPEDAPGVAVVTIDTWRAAYAGIMPRELLRGLDLDQCEAGFREFLAPTSEGRATWVALDGDRVIGFSSHGPFRDNDAPKGAGEIYAIYVLREHWRTGIGATLLRRSLTALDALDLAPVFLWVLTENPRARRFYEREGFTPVADRERVMKPARGHELAHTQYVRASR